MEFDNLLEFINKEDKRIKEHFDKNHSFKSERILARMVKLTEEVGELANEVLSFNGDQRKEKLVKDKKNNLSDEFADVMITTLLLAKSMNIDIEQALSVKIKKINERKYVD